MATDAGTRYDTPMIEARKLLRLPVRNAETPIERKPEWGKIRAKVGPQYAP